MSIYKIAVTNIYNIMKVWLYFIKVMIFTNPTTFQLSGKSN